MQQYKGKMLPENHPMTRMCERVVARLAPATGMEGVDWKVHVIDEDIPNAFVIPGGQIFVFSVLSLYPFLSPFYSILSFTLGLLPLFRISLPIESPFIPPKLNIHLSPHPVPFLLSPLHSINPVNPTNIKGILPIASNEDGLATILGHEIAHYTLRHIAEKNSLSQFFGIIGAFTAWMFGLPLDVFYQIQQVALNLPNSRACETEGEIPSVFNLSLLSSDLTPVFRSPGIPFSRSFLTHPRGSPSHLLSLHPPSDF
jgi:Zn-dependent protease with chaperone function